jgi:hypothetical protein
LHWADRLASYGATWLEEPVTSDDLEGLRLLRDHAPAGTDLADGTGSPATTSSPPTLFDGAVSAEDGYLHPDSFRPRLGLELKAADAEPFRISGGRLVSAPAVEATGRSPRHTCHVIEASCICCSKGVADT